MWSKDQNYLELKKRCSNNFWHKEIEKKVIISYISIGQSTDHIA